jgi:cell division protein FtsQ
VLWLELSDRLAWTAGLSDGLEIVYGNSEPLPATERLLAWLPSLGEHRAGALRRLDLRYPRGFAVTFKPQLTVPAESQPTPKAG